VAFRVAERLRFALSEVDGRPAQGSLIKSKAEHSGNANDGIQDY
jgi:hypothetical protein